MASGPPKDSESVIIDSYLEIFCGLFNVAMIDNAVRVLPSNVEDCIPRNYRFLKSGRIIENVQ